MCVSPASADGSGVLCIVWLWRELSFWRRAFDILVMRRPFGSWRRISLSLVGCLVISNNPVGAASMSGLIGFLVNVVCRGCHPWLFLGDGWGCAGILRKGAFGLM